MEINQNYPSFSQLHPRMQNAIMLKTAGLAKVFRKHAGENITNLASTHVPGIRLFHGQVEGAAQVLRNEEQLVYVVNRAMSKIATPELKEAFVDELYTALLSLKETVSTESGRHSNPLSPTDLSLTESGRNSDLTPEMIDQAIDWIEDVEITEGVSLRRYREDTLGLGTQNRTEM